LKIKGKKIVLIEWVDSHSGRGWQDLESLEASAVPLYCRSVGWLVKETEQCVVIVPHISGEKDGHILLQGCGDITIPTKAIVKEKILEAD
jgi:hypothetical protein